MDVTLLMGHHPVGCRQNNSGISERILSRDAAAVWSPEVVSAILATILPLLRDQDHQAFKYGPMFNQQETGSALRAHSLALLGHWLQQSYRMNSKPA